MNNTATLQQLLNHLFALTPQDGNASAECARLSQFVYNELQRTYADEVPMDASFAAAAMPPAPGVAPVFAAAA